MQGRDYSIECQIVKTHSHPILGLRACLDLASNNIVFVCKSYYYNAFK